MIASRGSIRAQSARESAGFGLEEAARRARVSPDYLRRIERNGGAPFALACRLSNLYDGAPTDIFLRRKEDRDEGIRTRGTTATAKASPNGPMSLSLLG